jgi:dihydroneopterin aldolase
MNGIMTIAIKDVRMHAFHGVFAEERKTGHSFLIDLSVDFKPVSGTITALSETIDYVRLYEFLKKEMEQPRALLETLVMELAEHIHIAFPGIVKVDIAITKTSPPITGFAGKVGVSYSRAF